MSEESPPSPKGTPPPKPQKEEEQPASPVGTPTSTMDTVKPAVSPPPTGVIPPELRRGHFAPRKTRVMAEPVTTPKPKTHPKRAPLQPRRPGEVRILTIIDVAGWAYDEGCKGLYKELRRIRPDWTLDKATAQEVIIGHVKPRDYDAVFVWAWWDAATGMSRTWDRLLGTLNERNSVLIFAGEAPIKNFNHIRTSIRRFHYAAANNAKLTKALRELTPYRRIFQLEYGVNLEKFKSTPFPPEFTVGWAGHQGRAIKRYMLAVEACEHLNIPLETAGHITTGAYLKPHQMPGFYGGISCLLITSASEVHPLVYYEALACGRPVVSTLVGDIEYTAKEGENGFYLPVDLNFTDLLDRLTRLRDDPTLMKRMGEQGRKDVEEKWNWGLIVKKFLTAVDELTGKFTACMLISRDNKQMEKAVRSVVRQKPAEFRAYIDKTMLPDSTRAEEILRKAGAKIFYQHTTDVEDHHDDVVHGVHRMILEAEYPRVLNCDDDDEIIGSVRNLVHLMGDDIGIVYGNVKQRFRSRHEVTRHGEAIEDPIDMAHMKGSVVFYNRDAFRRIHDNVDHGYFWDYKIGYWMMRAGYKLRYFNQTMSIQNVNPTPSVKRKSLYDAWPRMVERMNKQPLKLRN